MQNILCRGADSVDAKMKSRLLGGTQMRGGIQNSAVFITEHQPLRRNSTQRDIASRDRSSIDRLTSETASNSSLSSPLYCLLTFFTSSIYSPPSQVDCFNQFSRITGFRILQNLYGAALFHPPAFLHNQDMAADMPGNVKIMGHNQKGAALLL